MKIRLTSILLLFFVILIVIFPQSATKGAATGLLLWFRTLLPTLLPFMILTDLMLNYQVADLLCKILYPIFGRLFQLSHNGCFAMIVGLLCGYPMGAKVSADLVRSKKITESEGQYLLSLCNLASPVYINGFLLHSCLNVKRNMVYYFLCLYLPIIIISLMKRIMNRNRKDIYSIRNLQNETPNHNTHNDLSSNYTLQQASTHGLEHCVMCGLKSIAMLGGYVILFAVIQELLNSVTGFLPETLQLLLMGILEMTNGTEAISDSTLSDSMQTIMSLSLTSFGGCSCLFQTKSMLTGTNLSIRKYLVTKLFAALMTALFAKILVTYL